MSRSSEEHAVVAIEAVESQASIAARLFAEAQGAAGRHLDLCKSRAADLRVMANEIVNSGELYPHGLREQYRQLVDALEQSALRIERTEAEIEAQRQRDAR